MPEKRLREQVRDLARLRHLSLRTEEAYWNWIKRFILFHQKRHPRDLGADEISEFLTHLAVEGRVAASTQNQALNALLFLYRKVENWAGSLRRLSRPHAQGRVRAFSIFHLSSVIRGFNLEVQQIVV